ncbi:hypothetical protein D8S82_00560 [Mycobacterium hodleri]|uniref:Uncharacterized protein n=1 Tax=Mycolicibacterium hodleri TaxID=49897 RepID=A0A544W8I0_9MYCO|nr:hypothetical protein [Mycolicibacterium hodleri]TQR88535.1 hypothetical protein D8S82_00560 [Mycolicibacterium hodleri]
MSTPTLTDLADGADPSAIIMRQLAERAAHDPIAGMLLARLQSDEAANEPDRLEVLERRFDALLRANQQLREALVAADQMTAWIARLTGACPRCWGLAGDCSTCAGRGGPGYERPDVGELVDWLAPALRRSGLTIGRGAGPRPSGRYPLHTITEEEQP